MRSLEDPACARVLGIGVGHLLREVDGLHRPVGVEMGLRIAGIPHKSGGVQAAIEYLSGNA